MKIGVLKEIKPREYRVALIPSHVRELAARGHQLLVEHNAGAGAGFTDADYTEAGAKIADRDTVYTQAEMFCKVKEIFPEEYRYMKADKILFTYIHSNAHLEMTQALLDSGITSIAYEDVDDAEGRFPLLKPMSELAGKGGFLAALNFCQTVQGGRGILLSNVCGVSAPMVTIIGAGVSGMGAAQLAAAFGNRVALLDVNPKSLEAAKQSLPQNVSCLFSNRTNLVDCLKSTDVLINCILWDKTRKDHLVYREDLKLMKPGALIVDVACDDGGAIETCRSTSHDDPTYLEEGITHYAVDNIPSAFAHTASITLSNAVFPHILAVAQKGPKKALKDDKHLRRGLTTYAGKLTLEETAKKHNLPFTSPDDLVKEF